MTDPQQTHRADQALRHALIERAGDFEHLSAEAIDAVADGTLLGADLEIARAHLEMCAICREDVADILVVRQEIHEQTAARATATTVRWKGLAAIAAAVVLIALSRPWTHWSSSSDAPRDAAMQVAPARPASPAASNAMPSADDQSIVDAVLHTGRLDLPARVRALAGSKGTLLGADAPPAPLLPLTPIATAVISDTPLFSWKSIAGNPTYVVTIVDDRFNEVAKSEAVSTTTWTPSVKLPRGKTLAWQVKATFADGHDVLAPVPPQPEARFIVLDAPTADAITTKAAALQNQPLRQGILLAHAGVIDVAALRLEEAQRDPATKDIAARLLATIRK